MTFPRNLQAVLLGIWRSFSFLGCLVASIPRRLTPMRYGRAFTPSLNLDRFSHVLANRNPDRLRFLSDSNLNLFLPHFYDVLGHLVFLDKRILWRDGDISPAKQETPSRTIFINFPDRHTVIRIRLADFSDHDLAIVFERHFANLSLRDLRTQFLTDPLEV
jgi:hypothetical protein